MGTEVLSPGAKYGRGVMLTTHPHLVPSQELVGAIPPLPPSASMACSFTLQMKQAIKQPKSQAHIISNLTGQSVGCLYGVYIKSTLQAVNGQIFLSCKGWNLLAG
jgi:hypothetical protein